METNFIGKRGFYLDDLDTNGILLPYTPLLCRVKFRWLPTVPFDIVHPANALYDPINCRYIAFPEVVGLREMCNVFANHLISKQLFQNAMTQNTIECISVTLPSNMCE